MTYRNLTNNSLPRRLGDPFESSSSFGSSRSLESVSASATASASASNQNTPNSNYSYFNGSDSPTQQHLLAIPGLPRRAKAVLEPPPYDRYPAIADSRPASSTSLASALLKKTPFGPDFSPFGGYPASSFPLHINEKESDDYLHNPDPIADAQYDRNRFAYDMRHLDRRSFCGLLGIVFLFISALAVFVLLPVLTYSNVLPHEPYVETFEILTHYSYPLLSAIRTSLVDPDTPEEALTKANADGDVWNLVFSDEFNVEGRTFYEGDDQFFASPDIHYDATKDLEWYDPDAASTENGTLNLRMDAYQNHNLFYRSGMVTSWNRFCFTEGMILVLARLPNYGNVSGLWPGLWTMGNLGRPGYQATTEGVWPYSYEACDVGITANQSSPDGISYLPGQRLNSCTCSGEDHPNPGTGRGAPEIDIIEAESDTKTKIGVASQSYQLAPFDVWYIPDYSFVEVHDFSVTTMNTYAGGPFQQCVSGTTTLNSSWYERGVGARNFQVYGFEYANDDNEGYITWYVGKPTLTVHAYALAPNGNIDWRRIPKEPMSVVMNFGVSKNWAYIDWPSIVFPATMSIDYVRVYQDPSKISVTCDPENYPTFDYIQNHLNAYLNPNLTTWEEAGHTFPKNRALGQC